MGYWLFIVWLIHDFSYFIIHCSPVRTTRFVARLYIHTGFETDTHAHYIPGRVAGRNDLNYIVNSGKIHCT